MEEGEDFFNMDLDSIDQKFGILEIDRETAVQYYVDGNGVKRNPSKLLIKLQLQKIPSQEGNQIFRLSNMGEIGHPIWMLLNEIENGKHKGINHMAKFILSKLKGNI